MKFIDESTLTVIAGRGGDGCSSFRREKFVPFGGPDGGDGGDGGDVYLVADPNVNTLVEFRYKRHYKAKNGQGGSGSQCTGRRGEDLDIKVPLGTMVYVDETEEYLGDLVEPGQRLCVAKGGSHGLGNLRFKSSTNRAPRRTTQGDPGDQRLLRLELRLLADVGLLGLPNAGKSTLIRAVSAARPKVADYPFTTLVPNLGVVAVNARDSFVMADVPGLIEGAALGAGLGIQFLNHLKRTQILLHLVDLSVNDAEEILRQIRLITHELEQFSTELAQKPRWLVFSKADQCLDEESAALAKQVMTSLPAPTPYFIVSALSGQGTRALCQAVMTELLPPT